MLQFFAYLDFNTSLLLHSNWPGRAVPGLTDFLSGRTTAAYGHWTFAISGVDNGLLVWKKGVYHGLYQTFFPFDYFISSMRR